MITSKLADQPLVTEINPTAKNSTASPQAVSSQKKADDGKKNQAELFNYQAA